MGDKKQELIMIMVEKTQINERLKAIPEQIKSLQMEMTKHKHRLTALKIMEENIYGDDKEL